MFSTKFFFFEEASLLLHMIKKGNKNKTFIPYGEPFFDHE